MYVGCYDGSIAIVNLKHMVIESVHHCHSGSIPWITLIDDIIVSVGTDLRLKAWDSQTFTNKLDTWTCVHDACTALNFSSAVRPYIAVAGIGMEIFKVSLVEQN